MRRILLTIFLVIALITISGCQLPTANYFRDQVFPQETLPKVLLSPVLFPGYAVLSVVDIAVVNPVRGCANVPDSVSSVWNWQNEPTPGIGAALIPVKIIAIPPAALGTAIFSEQFIYQDEPTKRKS